MTNPAEDAAEGRRLRGPLRRREFRTLVARSPAAFAQSLLAERERWFLWLPVAMGIGIALYFALHREPAPWIGPAILGAAVATAAAGWRRAGVRLGAIVLATAALGFCAAQWRAQAVAAPVIENRVAAIVSGQVATVEARPSGVRVTIEQPSIGDLAAEQTPRRVRVTVRTRGHSPRPGEWIRVRAVLMPPPPPAAPGAFDFPRQAWFKGLGGVGFAVGKVELI